MPFVSKLIGLLLFVSSSVCFLFVQFNTSSVEVLKSSLFVLVNMMDIVLEVVKYSCGLSTKYFLPSLSMATEK